MSDYVGRVNLAIPGEIEESVRALKSTVYRDKTLTEIYRIMIWRGLERTEELLNCRTEN